MNEGVGVVMSGLDFRAAVIAPICVGMAERALQLSLEHALNVFNLEKKYLIFK